MLRQRLGHGHVPSPRRDGHSQNNSLLSRWCQGRAGCSWQGELLSTAFSSTGACRGSSSSLARTLWECNTSEIPDPFQTRLKASKSC